MLRISTKHGENNGFTDAESDEDDADNDDYHDYVEKKQQQLAQPHKQRDYADELTTTVLLPPLEMAIEEQRVLGYMPLRDDFEREYKNDAETLLSNLSIANNQIVYLNSTLAKASSTALASLNGGVGVCLEKCLHLEHV